MRQGRDRDDGWRRIQVSNNDDNDDDYDYDSYCFQFCQGHTACLSKAGRFADVVCRSICNVPDVAFANAGCPT